VSLRVLFFPPHPFHNRIGRLLRYGRRGFFSKTGGVFLTLPWLTAFWWFGGPSTTMLRLGPFELTLTTP